MCLSCVFNYIRKYQYRNDICLFYFVANMHSSRRLCRGGAAAIIGQTSLTMVANMRVFHANQRDATSQPSAAVAAKQIVGSFVFEQILWCTFLGTSNDSRRRELNEQQRITGRAKARASDHFSGLGRIDADIIRVQNDAYLKHVRWVLYKYVLSGEHTIAIRSTLKYIDPSESTKIYGK